ncbi:Protein pleiotropic regulatory locus 1 [Capsicum annuum]|uniref:protein pleiotropic regulatory locus 1 n=1 Tax=Capsicum annuum TaxID=4072 RepID=UPI001FB053C9|nr:protein pleiotropic regulatory locus 1 [Capsicum annuum]KAF3613585.1 Protein pleiotropic regulatory locus 1 [Capsicum annuum]KAF3614439.1 Protein pleiotropic regulatory locus 1 [Capsicum annuum]
MSGATMESEVAVEPQSLKKLSFKSLKRSLDLFAPLHSHFPLPDPLSKKIRTSYKLNVEYGGIKGTAAQPSSNAKAAVQNQVQQASAPFNVLALPGPENARDEGTGNELALGPSIPAKGPTDVRFSGKNNAVVPSQGSSERNLSTAAIMERIPSKWPRPIWRAPWKNYRVISGHLGWVRSVAVDPSNTWFCTGSADRTIKIWDLASGRLKLTLTGHIEQVRGLAVSDKHTYMFSAGDDKLVKCWDLEQNKVIRSYHGHLSGVYCLALHPTIDILFTGGRDSVCRVWDIRSKMQIHALSGHDNTVCSVFTRPMDPQVITGSHDSTIKFWDLRYGKTMATLTHHKKSVRAMAQHPSEDCFASASADNIKKFSLPKGEFMHNMLAQQKTIVNAMAVNDEGVMVTGGDNGSMWFWDWKSGHNFQQAQTVVQPGSLDSEAGIYALTYDVTGSRLISCEADKTIKMWKEDETATPETHPLHFKPPKDIRRF